MTKSAFQRVYERIIDKAPQLVPKNTQIIHEWIKQGYDVDKDILPAIDDKLKYLSKTIYSFAFFDAPIKQQHQRRLKEQNTPKELAQSEKDANRAKSIAFRIRKMGQCCPTDERWLNQYEAQHGRVDI